MGSLSVVGYNNSGIVTLEELAYKGNYVLFDTSAIISPLGKGMSHIDDKIIKEKADFKEENNNFLDKMTKYIISNGNFFATSYVLEEIIKIKHYNYKKKIRKEGSCRNHELLRLRRLIKMEEYSKKRIVNSFIDNNKVILIEHVNKNIYDNLIKKYHKFIDEYNLNHTDFDFLLTGMTLVAASNSVIFVSNDYKIFHARNRILKREKIEEQNAQFFTRIDFLKFQQLFYYKNHKIEQLSGSS